MPTYLSLLRGINVSGQKLIKMDALRRMYEHLGYQRVTSYLLSGNIVFEAGEVDHHGLEQAITRQIALDFGYEVTVLVLTPEQLQTIIANNPFTSVRATDPAFLFVTFLADQPWHHGIEAIADKKQPDEQFHLSSKVVYLYCPSGYGKTKLNNNFLETQLKVRATTRNWKTVNELNKLLQTVPED
ncbi:MAG: DUF1697 domain-containing protein [Prolixibacteraceae bacterium]|nr:DUF1697 domain-containing protein [Prolixibacteraceae bacterium]